MKQFTSHATIILSIAPYGTPRKRTPVDNAEL